MSSTLRRGLPRVAGGEPWPPEGTPAPATEFAPSAPLTPSAPAVQASTPAEPSVDDSVSAAAAPVVAEQPAAAQPVAAFRRGLPRVAGGEPWPPASAAPAGIAATAAAPVTESAPPAEVMAPTEVAAPAPAPVAAAPVGTEPVAAATASGSGSSSGSGAARQGLPRVAGGEPWPATGTVVHNVFAPEPAASAAPAPAASAPAASAPAAAASIAPVAAETAPAVAQPAPTPVAPAQVSPAAAEAAPAPPAPARPPAQPTPATQPTPAAASTAPKPKAEAKKYGIFTLKQWFGAGAIILLAIVGAVTLVVLAARWFMSLEFMTNFVNTYPGEYHLPESAPVGFPGWLGWQHFFNIFLMVLIIRSGILVRRQERPEAFWASKKNPKKISIQLWLHQSLNILWIVNGLIFIILLFATGQWMRVIPTSFEVFPNALSAGLQYLTLDWPIDNGWVNYNSLQQLAYFATIFIAAPLSAITGFRMSESWPRESKLSEKFPVEWARNLHFPLMIYFVGFIVVHVALVFSTGALRNLNHMFAAQGAVDPTLYANNWTGFWLFVASIVVVIGAWLAARPMIMAPIARIFGNVSAR